MKAIKSLAAVLGLAVIAGCGAENKAINLLQVVEVQKWECVTFPTEGCKNIPFCYLGSDYDHPFPIHKGEPNAEFYVRWGQPRDGQVTCGVDKGDITGFMGCKADILSFDKDKIRVYWH
ncbi:MAG: hypothetical protein PHO02_06245 [Candidatus Nanoarchaeia archaeon]|nr:hypothetical protein [Candidatus Nanoarchaeia archaeon]